MGASERDIGDDGRGGAKWPLMTGVRVFHVHCPPQPNPTVLVM